MGWWLWCWGGGVDEGECVERLRGGLRVRRGDEVGEFLLSGFWWVGFIGGMRIFCVLMFLGGICFGEEVTTKAQVHEGWVDLLEKDVGGDFGTKFWRSGNVDEGTFGFKVVEGEEVFVCSGKPTGVIRSAGVYENFLVEFEWRHMERDGMRANAGFFVWSDALPSVGIPFSRSVEVQICNFDNNTDWYTRHGDVFAIHGAKMEVDPRFGKWARGQRSLPLEFRAKGTGEWNKYRILCVDGTIQLEVNGKVVSGGYHVNPRKGHLMIESEGGEVHFRRMRVLELKPDARGLLDEQVADVLAADVKVDALYSGVDLEGWVVSEGGDFKVADYRLVAVKGEARRKLLGQTGKVMVDFYLDGEVGELPVGFGGDRTGVKLGKGVHRLEVDLVSGDWWVDGDKKRSLLKVGDELVLYGLGAKGYFANVFWVK